MLERHVDAGAGRDRITSSVTSEVVWLMPASSPRSAARASLSSDDAVPKTNARACRAMSAAAAPRPLRRSSRARSHRTDARHASRACGRPCRRTSAPPRPSRPPVPRAAAPVARRRTRGFPERAGDAAERERSADAPPFTTRAAPSARAAAVRHIAHHPLPGRPGRDAVAHGVHHPHRLHAANERQGNGEAACPRRTCRSKLFSPAAVTRTATWPGPGVGRARAARRAIGTRRTPALSSPRTSRGALMANGTGPRRRRAPSSVPGPPR